MTVSLYIKNTKTTLLFSSLEEKKQYVKRFLKPRKIQYRTQEVVSSTTSFSSDVITPAEYAALEGWAAQESSTYTEDTQTVEENKKCASLLSQRLAAKGLLQRKPQKTHNYQAVAAALEEDDLLLDNGVLLSATSMSLDFDVEITDLVLGYQQAEKEGASYLQIPFVAEEWVIEGSVNYLKITHKIYSLYELRDDKDEYLPLNRWHKAKTAIVYCNVPSYCTAMASNKTTAQIATWVLTYFFSTLKEHGIQAAVSEAWRFRAFREKVYTLVCKERPDLYKALQKCGFWVSLSHTARILLRHDIRSAQDIKNFLSFVPAVWVADRPFGSSYQPCLWHVKVVACANNYRYVPMWCKKLLCTVYVPSLHSGATYWTEKRHGDVWRSVVPACRIWQLDPSVPLRYAKRLSAMSYLNRVRGVLAHRHCAAAMHGTYTAKQFWSCFRDFADWSKLDLLHTLRCGVSTLNCSKNPTYTKYTAKQLVSGMNSKLTSAAAEVLQTYIVQHNYAHFLHGFKYSVLEKLLAEQLYTPNWYSHTAVVLTSLFGKQYQVWLQKWSSVNNNTDIHDATYWLYANPTPKLGDYLLRWVAHAKQYDLALITQHCTPQHDLSLKPSVLAAQIRQEISEYRYNRDCAVETAFALESMQHDISRDSFHDYLPRWVASLETPHFLSMIKQSDLAVEINGLRGSFLQRQDPRGLYLGHYTNCCQHPSGVGASCAWAGQEHPQSGFFVVEDKDQNIIAQSWCWYTEDGFCFDNVEAKGLGQRTQTVQAIYQQVADRLCYPRVTMGTGLSDLQLMPQWVQTAALQCPTGGYSDAGKQVLLAVHKTHNQPTPAKQQQQVVIRTAYESDLTAAESVARQCYIDNWAQSVSLPDSPQNIVAYVIDHAQAGVVGYIVADSAQRYICDLAVLPQYRRYTMRLVQHFMGLHAGTWTADLMPDSLRLLTHMADRGLLSVTKTGSTDYGAVSVVLQW